MAYLQKGLKVELRYIAEKLGERVTDDLKTIHLKNLIRSSTNYEEEFAREMLNTRVQERRKASTSCIGENYDTIEGHNSYLFKLRKLPKCNTKGGDKISVVQKI
ncbi:hypothetical protein NPIL_494751 [Nephila pilipes]|uniref:Uncharacterized protein n=1 Tax=Nephila pilipes TaxID=299642 RepID=A0A8X6MUU3_NEPPI|nr:hypothetical protein NPIL_494751 [Nephila pilipes]